MIKEYPWTSTGLKPNAVRPECKLPGYEFTWDRVQRERKEGHPKYKGGNYVEVPITNDDVQVRFGNSTRRVLIDGSYKITS
jgi:hypothetical protein